MFTQVSTIHLSHFGGLAQLARALAWHARGHRFESGILHLKDYGKPYRIQNQLGFHKVFNKRQDAKMPVKYY